MYEFARWHRFAHWRAVALRARILAVAAREQPAPPEETVEEAAPADSVGEVREDRSETGR